MAVSVVFSAVFSAVLQKQTFLYNRQRFMMIVYDGVGVVNTIVAFILFVLHLFMLEVEAVVDTYSVVSTT